MTTHAKHLIIAALVAVVVLCCHLTASPERGQRQGKAEISGRSAALKSLYRVRHHGESHLNAAGEHYGSRDTL